MSREGRRGRACLCLSGHNCGSLTLFGCKLGKRFYGLLILIKSNILVDGLISACKCGTACRAISYAGERFCSGISAVGEHITVEEIFAIAIVAFMIEIIEEQGLINTHTVTDKHNVVLCFLSYGLVYGSSAGNCSFISA